MTTFALASCQYPTDMLERMPDFTNLPDGPLATPGPADASLLALGKIVLPPAGVGKPEPAAAPPTLLLLVGDQVYTDGTAGLFDPKAPDDKYRIPYLSRKEGRGLRDVKMGFGTRIQYLPDDHEIGDNWEPGGPVDPKDGIEGFWKYQRNVLQPVSGQPVWRNDLVHDGLPFFLGDTRTERDGRTVENVSRPDAYGRTVQHWSSARIVGDAQFKALCDWLVAPGNAALPKFVATPSALLPRRLAVARDPACALHSDAWDGYPRSLHDLLSHACDNNVEGLVFLSGDEHISNVVEACVTDSRNPKNQCVLHSVHSSALYAPYPFANAIQEDFARSETFNFPDPYKGPYCCKVNTWYPPEGDGFAVLTAVPSSGGRWDLNVVFHGANGPKVFRDPKCTKKPQPDPITLF